MGTLAGRFEEISIGLVDANDWNPNQMQDKTFDRLCKEIEESGMNSPIQVIPIEKEGTTRYRILGGEHRFQACRVLGYKFIPAIILSDPKLQDEDVQKFVTMRLNVIAGQVNPDKMMKMYQDLAKRYDKEALGELMGYTDQDAFRKLVGEIKKGAKKAGLPKEAVAEIEKAAMELKTVDNLGAVLNRIFTEYGDTVPNHFVWFDFGGKKHVHVSCDAKTFKKVEAMLSAVKKRDARADEVFAQLMQVWDEVVELDEKPTAKSTGFLSEVEGDDEDQQGWAEETEEEEGDGDNLGDDDYGDEDGELEEGE